MYIIEAFGNLYKHKKNTKIFITHRDNTHILQYFLPDFKNML